MAPTYKVNSRARRRQRGFTLIELTIAMAAGLIVAMAAFLMARNSSAFFQNESRLTGAQFASMVGMTRLQNDIRRAGLQSSPNVRLDPNVCGYSAAWPNGMRELAGIKIIEGGSALDHPGDLAASTHAKNGLNPDSLVLGGMMTSTEHFSVAAVQSTGGGSFDVYIETDGAYWRTQLASQAGGTAFDRVFVVGSYIRLVDQEGRAAFGVITGVTEGAAGTKPRISISGTPAMGKRETTGSCGCTGICTGSIVNPVTRVRYDLRKIDPAVYTKYAGMFPKANVNGNKPAQFKGEVEAPRTELVRVELDSDDKEIKDTLEVVAEYAVDFKFGLTETDPGPLPNLTPIVTRRAIGDKKVYDKVGSIQALGRPEHVSSVQVRLTTRAPFSDRRTGITLTTPDKGIYRFYMGDAVGTYARARTLIADVYLANQAGVTW